MIQSLTTRAATTSRADHSATLRVAAYALRSKAYEQPLGSPTRESLLNEAQAVSDLADRFSDLLNDIMRRAIELALAEIDEQAGEGIPRKNQHVRYARIFAQVRDDLASD